MRRGDLEDEHNEGLSQPRVEIWEKPNGELYVHLLKGRPLTIFVKVKA